MMPYWWFQGKPVDELKARLDAAGEGARLECRIGEGFSLWLRVVPKGATTLEANGGDINDSRVCPPICPE